MFWIFVCSLRDVQEMRACRADHVCLSVYVFENRWTDLDEIWYGHYDIGVYSKIVLSDFLQSVVSTLWTNGLLRWAPLKWNRTLIYDNRFSKNTQLWYNNSLYNVKQRQGSYIKIDLTRILFCDHVQGISYAVTQLSGNVLCWNWFAVLKTLRTHNMNN
jgi:hypothetical protein